MNGNNSQASFQKGIKFAKLATLWVLNPSQVCLAALPPSKTGRELFRVLMASTGAALQSAALSDRSL